MSRRDALLLKVASVWTLLIWAVFVKNLLGDDSRPTGFKVVHMVLAVVSMAFGVVIWGVAARSRRRTGTPV